MYNSFVFYFIHYFWLSADLPTSEISSKHDKSAEEAKDEAEKETVKEEKIWPEPQKRVCPPVRAALILPDNVTCPAGCQRFSSTEDLDPATVSKLRYEVLTHHGYSFIIQHIVYFFNNPDQLLFLSSKTLYFFPTREKFSKDGENNSPLTTLSSLVALIDKMENHEVMVILFYLNIQQVFIF